MRFLTSGESHGEYLTAVIEGFPRGVTIRESFLNQELQRRMFGYGRGERMDIEKDRAHFTSGLRGKKTLGSPICILIANRDHRIFTQKQDNQIPLSIPRPAHADLAGALKYNEYDIRNILERSSARETAARVCVGAVCKQFLSEFGVSIASFVRAIGTVNTNIQVKGVKDILLKTKESLLRCPDKKAEILMKKEIDKAKKKKDTLGGVIEVWAQGLAAGLGSPMHFDKRLDAKISYYVMSIPAVKAVEFGLGFEYARQLGSHSHDEIFYSSKRGFYRKSNHSGGIEGGMTTGEPIVFRLAMKPIATLLRPLASVNLVTKQKKKAVVERSDTCAVSACGVVAESMLAIALTESFLAKFGEDSLKQIKANYRSYIKSLQKF